MALSMVHLIAAQRWAQGHPQYLRCPEFYLGALSPDAIHVRDHDDKSHKNAVHLNNWISPHPEEVLAYWRERAEPFDIGYGVHVLTDGQWVPRYRRLVPQFVLPDGRTDASRYYPDTLRTDAELYRDCGGVALFDMVLRAQVPADHPLLTRDELDRWRADKAAEYRSMRPSGEKAQFLDRAYVERFLTDCMPLLEETYSRHLQEGSL